MPGPGTLCRTGSRRLARARGLGCAARAGPRKRGGRGGPSEPWQPERFLATGFGPAARPRAGHRAAGMGRDGCLEEGRPGWREPTARAGPAEAATPEALRGPCHHPFPTPTQPSTCARTHAHTHSEQRRARGPWAWRGARRREGAARAGGR